MLPSAYRLERLRGETHDTFTLEFRPSRGRGKFAFKPGQFNMLYVFGAGEVPISISGDPAASGPLKHTIRAVGNVTRLLRRLKPGNAVGIRGPYGSHWPVEEARGRDVVIVAGGIGLAPLRPALYSLLHRRQKYRRVILLYGTRAPEDILYKKELKVWRSELDMEVHVTVDRAAGSWRGNVDVVTSLIPRTAFDPENALAMVCGPEAMMKFTARSLLQRGLTEEDIFVSMERNMKCAVGFCGNCQYGPYFICKDGPVFRYDRVGEMLRTAEI